MTQHTDEMREAFENSPASLPHYLGKHPDGQYRVALTQNVFRDFSVGYQAASAETQRLKERVAQLEGLLGDVHDALVKAKEAGNDKRLSDDRKLYCVSLMLGGIYERLTQATGGV